MNEQKYIPLPLSRKLAEMGIKVESEFSYYETTDSDDEIGFNRSSDKSCISCGHPTPSYIQEIPAYTLGEMPNVLKVMGEKMGWKLQDDKYCVALSCNLSYAPFYGEYKISSLQYHFLELCRIYADSPKKAWEYLEGLIISSRNN